MKIWRSHGSEHSMNLVLIGHFKDVTKAASAELKMQRLTDWVRDQADRGELELGTPDDRFTDQLMDVFREVGIYYFSPDEIQQFAYDATVRVDESKLIVETDEADVSAYLKVMLDGGARIEVFSTDDHPAQPEQSG